MSTEYIKINNHWEEVLSVYKKISGVWVEQTDINSCMSQSSIYFYNPEQIDIERNPLTIECPDTITGTSGNAIARYNSITVIPTWSITSGNAYATIDNSGNITIVSSGNVTIQAEYNDFTTTKDISVVYDANTETEISIDNYGNITTETTTTSVDSETGATTTTVTSTTINIDGTSVSIESETTVNQDGSSSISTTTMNYDENGDLTGSIENETTNNTDGSSTSVTTNYDANGDPTTGSTNNIDTLGNSSTKDVEYDENGNTTVTAYSIDTSENSTTGTHLISGQEVDTDYYAFDPTHGFELMIYFYFDFSLQTENQATILNAKRSDPQPWYGFDIRRNSSGLQYGVCFYGAHKVNGSSKNSGDTTRGNLTRNSDNIYMFKINYDPTVTSGETTFTIYDMIHNTTVVTSDGLFPDEQALKYIDVMIGCNLTKNGTPQRRAVMEVYDFYVRRTT